MRDGVRIVRTNSSPDELPGWVPADERLEENAGSYKPRSGVKCVNVKVKDAVRLGYAFGGGHEFHQEKL